MPPVKFLDEQANDAKYSGVAAVAANTAAIAVLDGRLDDVETDVIAAQAAADAAQAELDALPDIAAMDSRLNIVESDMALLNIPQLQQDIQDINDAMTQLGLDNDPVLLADEGWTGSLLDPKDIGAFAGIKSIDSNYVTFSGLSNFKKGTATLIFDILAKFKYSEYVDALVKTKQQLYLNIWTETIGVAEVDKIFYAHGSVNVTTPSYPPIVHGTEIFPLYHANYSEHGTILKRTDPEFTGNLTDHGIMIDVNGNYHQIRWAIDTEIYVNNPPQNIFDMSYTKIFTWNNELTVFEDPLNSNTHPALDGEIVGHDIAGYVNPKFLRFTSVSGGPTILNPIYTNITFPILATNATSVGGTATKVWFRVPSDFLSSGVLSSVTNFSGSIYHTPSAAPTPTVVGLSGSKFTNFNPDDIFDNSYGSFALTDLTLDANQSWYSNSNFSKVTVNAALIPDPKNIRYFKSNLKPFEPVVKVEYVPGVTPTYDIWFRNQNGAAVNITPINLGFIEFFNYELTAIGSATAYIGSVVTAGAQYVFEDSDGATPVIMTHDGILRDRVPSTTGTYTPYATQDTIFCIRWNNTITAHGATLSQSRYLSVQLSNGKRYRYPIIGYSDTTPSAHLVFFRAPVFPSGITNIRIIYNITSLVSTQNGTDFIASGPTQIFPSVSVSPTAFNPANISDAAYGYFASATTVASGFIIGANINNTNSSAQYNQMSYIAIDGIIPGGYTCILSNDRSRIIKITSSEYSTLPAPNGTTYIYFYDPSMDPAVEEGFFYGVAPIATFVLDNGTTPVTRNIIGAGDATLNNPPVNGPNGPQGFARTDYTDVISTAVKTTHTLSSNPTIVTSGGVENNIKFKLIDNRKLLINTTPNVVALFDSTFQELLNGVPTPKIDGTYAQFQVTEKKAETVDVLTSFVLTGGNERKYLWKNVSLALVATVPAEVASVTKVRENDKFYKFRHFVTTEVQGDGSTNIYINVYEHGPLLCKSTSAYNSLGNMTSSHSMVALKDSLTGLVSANDTAARALILAGYTHAFIQARGGTYSESNVKQLDIPGSTAGIIKFTTPLTITNGYQIEKIVGINAAEYNNDYDDVLAGWNLSVSTSIDVYSDKIGTQRVNKPHNAALIKSVSSLYNRTAPGFEVESVEGGYSNIASGTNYGETFAVVKHQQTHFAKNNIVYNALGLPLSSNYTQSFSGGTDTPTPYGGRFLSSEIENFKAINPSVSVVNVFNYLHFNFNNIEYSFDFIAHAVRNESGVSLVQTLLRVTTPTVKNQSAGLIVDGNILKIWAYSTSNLLHYWFYDTAWVKTAEGSVSIGNYRTCDVHKRVDTGLIEAYLVHNDKLSVSRIVSDTMAVWREIDINPIYVNPYVDQNDFIASISLNKYNGQLICSADGAISAVNSNRIVNLYQPYRVNNYHGLEKLNVSTIKNIQKIRVIIATDVEHVSKLYGEIISNNLIPRKIGQGDTFIDINSVRHADTIGFFAKINGSTAANPLWECTNVPGFFGTPVTEIDLVDNIAFASTFYDDVPPKDIDISGPNGNILFPLQIKQVSTDTNIMVVSILEWIDDDNNMRRSFILMTKGVANKYNHMEAAYTYAISTDNYLANI